MITDASGNVLYFEAIDFERIKQLEQEVALLKSLIVNN